MKFYNSQHPFYCGIDLHSKTLHACVVDDRGEKLLHRNFQLTFESNRLTSPSRTSPAASQDPDHERSTNGKPIKTASATNVLRAT